MIAKIPTKRYAALAFVTPQLVTLNQRVLGSNPSAPTKKSLNTFGSRLEDRKVLAV
jgi:hypothetical protein